MQTNFGIPQIDKAWGFLITAPDEQQISDILSAVQPGSHVSMPCGYVAWSHQIQKRFYKAPCPCGDPTHTLIEVRQELEA